MALADRQLTLRRDDSGEVLARGGDPEAHSILERTAFVPIARPHDRYHRLPTSLDKGEEIRLATRAVARLRAVQYHVDCDGAFDTSLREPHHLSLGTQVAHLAELTASHDGILAALDEVLTAAADFYQHLGQGADPHYANRLRFLASERLGVIASDLQHTRTELADRHQAPHRIACSGEVPPDENEASAVCACPPAPRIAAAPPSLTVAGPQALNTLAQGGTCATCPN
ncbi:hypothetical protein WKI65_21725 [Streptomyces sp. MS1.AVA.3]|uniref:hypothetical protein n=1 Tax=Streptomyces decoyicus TaxID=249567 RepID=UPI0030C45154